MKNNNLTHQKPQLNFNFGSPLKQLEIIECYQCKERSELDGYRFKLVPLCACCRTEREIEIVGNRYERRQQR
jgi:hypothetical protein